MSFRGRFRTVVPAVLIAGLLVGGAAGAQTEDGEDLDPTEPMTLLIEIIDPQGDKCVAASQAMIAGSNLYGYIDEDIAPMPVRFDMFNTALAYAVPTLPEEVRPTAAAVATSLVEINDANRSTTDFDPLRIAMRQFFLTNHAELDATVAALLDGCAEFDGYPREIALAIAQNPSWDVAG